MKLRVASARSEEVVKDIIRVSRLDRGGIPSGQICKVTVEGRKKYFIVRGLSEEQNGQILMDDLSRQSLGVDLGKQYDFEIQIAGIIGKIWWACTVTDPGARIAAWLGVLSVALGFLGVVLGALSLRSN